MKNIYKKIITGTVITSLFVYSLISLFQPVHADQTISVTGTVPPQASDFQATITSDISTTAAQGKIITYTITYGSHLYYAGQLIIEAQWYQGTLSGASTPSVDIAQYVAGSSTDAYNSTQAVVDTINQKVDWTISSFPSQTTDQTVKFSLQTTGNYTGTNTVSFPVHVRLMSPSFTTADQAISQVYQYNPALTASTPTPTAAPQPTTTPVPSSTPIPTATAAPVKMNITGVVAQTISPTSLQLSISTSLPAALTTFYGTSPTALTNTIASNDLGSYHNVLLDNLIPNTHYYIKLQSADVAGNTATSEIFVFTTASTPNSPQVNPESVTFVSSNILLYLGKTANQNAQAGAPAKPTLILPQNTSYNFQFQVSKPETIRRIQIVVRNKFVLGITSADAAEPNTYISDLIETANGIYQGSLQSPVLPGTYESFARVSDIHGNISEQRLADVIVSEPFTVLSSSNQQPIEGAQVYYYYKDYRTKSFLALPPQLFPIKNPSYTNLAGQILFPLPQGNYKAVVTGIGYGQKTVFFTIGPNPGETYPTVLLTTQPFNVITLGEYYVNIAQDVLGTTKSYIQSISYSTRFFDLNAVLATAILVFLTLLSFSSRIHIPLRFLGTYFLHFTQISAVQRKLGNKIKGRLFDEETGDPISGADVYILDERKNDIIAHTTSGNQGDFLFNFLPTAGYGMQVMAKDFEPTTFRESEIHAVELGGYLLGIKKRETSAAFAEVVGVFTQKGLGLLFEVLIITSLLFEISIGYALGWDKTMLFICFSIINLFLWILHLSHLHAQKNVF